MFKRYKFLFLDDIISNDLYDNTYIFLNGRFIGLYSEPAFLFKYVKLLKLNSIININASVLEY